MGAVHHRIVMTDKTSEPQISGYSQTPSGETTEEEDRLKDLSSQDALQTEPIKPKNSRRVSFSTIVALPMKPKSGEVEDESSNPVTNPCHNDKKLQILSFVSLFMLVVIAISILVAEFNDSKEIPITYISGFERREFPELANRIGPSAIIN